MGFRPVRRGWGANAHPYQSHAVFHQKLEFTPLILDSKSEFSQDMHPHLWPPKFAPPFSKFYVLGIPVMRYSRAARPCALNFCLAALKCHFGHPLNALSSVRVWPSMPPLCASFIQNIITLTGHIFIGKNVAYPNTVTCLLISNCSGKQTD